MPARCRQRASVSPPMPAPTIATRSAVIAASGRLEDLQAARRGGPARHVVDDGGAEDPAVLVGDEPHRAGAVVEAVEALVGVGRRRRDPGVLDRAVGLHVAGLPRTVTV